MIRNPASGLADGSRWIQAAREDAIARMTAVSVIGLGKLGACIAACYAARGFTTIGVDINPTTIQCVNAGEPPVFEPALADMMRRGRGRLRATLDYGEAIKATDVSFIVVPTPSDSDGRFSLRFVKAAARELGQALAAKTSYHLVVLTSTVLPGSTEYGVLPVLEAASGKRCGVDFGLCYSPQFIALGSVIRDFLNPDLVLIGESDSQAGEMLACLTQRVVDKQPAIARMNWVNAELAKISVNTYVTMKITFANMLAALCERLPGADVDVVTGAIGCDSRIGARYLKGALGYGGPCFPRDNLALAYLARQIGEPALLAEATDTYNRAIVDRLLTRIRAYLSPGARIAILGLAYKPETNVVEEAQGIKLAQGLAHAGFEVVVHDPLALGIAREVLGDRVMYAATLEEATRTAEMIIVATPAAEYQGLCVPTEGGAQRPILLDGWRLLRGRLGESPDVLYLPVGVGTADERQIALLADLWRD